MLGVRLPYQHGSITLKAAAPRSRLGGTAAMGTRLPYQHGFHAGNFADVAKHSVLVLLLEHMRKKAAVNPAGYTPTAFRLRVRRHPPLGLFWYLKAGRSDPSGYSRSHLSTRTRVLAPTTSQVQSLRR